MLALIWLLAIINQNTSVALEPQQLARIMAGLHAPIEDVELVCEGTVEFVDSTDPKHVEKSNRFNSRFQANYAYRSDGACYLEIFTRTMAHDSLVRKIDAVLGGTLTRIALPADQKPELYPRQVDNGTPGSLFYDGSPHRFILVWKFLKFIESPNAWAYDVEGWEDLDGVRCLKIVVNPFPGSSQSDGARSRLWIDLERGGHVLKEEYSRGGNLWYRIHSIKLEEFQLRDGKSVWFPVHGELDSFASGDQFLSHPVSHESYDVVRGSVVFNQKLPDSRFSVDWNGKKTESAELEEARRKFEEKQRMAKSEPGPRTDPAGVEEELNRMLDEADAQARQLEATPPSHRTWNGVTLMQATIAMLSLGILVTAVYLRSRHR